MTTMAVTGAGGFIGTRMLQRAIGRRLEVRGLDVSAAAAARAATTGVRVQVGDVGDPEAARKLCEGADVVFHTAAIVGEGGDFDLYRRVNVEGTRNMARAAAQAGVKHFVHLSSVMVYGFTYPPNVGEDGPLRGENNAYCQTKIESEQALREAANGMKVTIIRPGDVYGPGSIPWVVRPLEIMRRRMFMLPDGGRGILNHVYVDNLLDAVFLTIDEGVTGTFNVTDGVATTFKDYFNRLAALIGRRGVPTLPAPILKGIVRAVGRIERLLGREPMGSPEAVDFLNRRNLVSIERARRELGYAPQVGLDEGLRQVETWLRTQGML